MLIGWVADLTIDEHRGGGQQTNHEMVLYGRERGHSIDYITPHRYNPNTINKYELLITNKIIKFSVDNKKSMIKRPYIRYEHDYESVLFDPMCKKLYENSLLNIFLSPLHLETFNGHYANRYGKNIENTYLQPSPVIGFKKANIGPKANTVIWSGELQPHKGINNVIEYAIRRPNLKFNFYILSHSHPTELKKIQKLKNVTIKNELKTKEQMNRAYSEHEYFIHLPVWKEPFGRTVLEAYLSGCKLIVNNNVGAMSYNWNFNDYNSIVDTNNKSTENFWKKIETTI